MHAPPILTSMPRKSQNPQRPANKLHNYVSEYRKLSGMTQEELAEKAGISQSVMSRIERRMVSIMDDKRIALAKALGLKNPQLVYVNPQRPDLNAEAADLDEDDIEEIRQIILLRKKRKMGAK
jgi:transcriptional regulator with XRE-family HTH domain